MPRKLVRIVAGLLPAQLRTVLRQAVTPPLETLPDCPELFHSYRYLVGHLAVQRQPGGWVYEGKFYPDYLMMGGASHAVSKHALRYCSGAGIDVGAGFWPLPGARPVDVVRGPGTTNAVADFAPGSLDYIFSSHCLEHIADWQNTLREWVAKLKPGGVLFLYLPHPDCGIWRRGSPFVGEHHQWIPNPSIVKQALTELGTVLLEGDDGPDGFQSFYICVRKPPLDAEP